MSMTSVFRHITTVRALLFLTVPLFLFLHPQASAASILAEASQQSSVNPRAEQADNAGPGVQVFNLADQSCDDVFDEVEIFLIIQGLTERQANRIAEDILDLCESHDWPASDLGGIAGDIQACVAEAVACDAGDWAALEFDPPNDPGLSLIEMIDILVTFLPACDDASGGVEAALVADGVVAVAAAAVAADILGLCEANSWSAEDEAEILEHLIDCLDMNECDIDSWNEAFGGDPPCICISIAEIVEVVVIELAPPRTFFVQGTGPNANPPILFLDLTAPVAGTAKYRDSDALNFNGGNAWKEVGSWSASPAAAQGTLVASNRVILWLGLKNSDDQGTRFDVRVDADKNGALLTSGLQRCIEGLTRNANLAKQIGFFLPAPGATQFNGTSDTLNLRVWARIGTNPDDTKCMGHNNATGLRVYFGSATRPSALNTKYLP
jgi:hypothetical protein